MPYLLVIISLSILILVHELGHFLTAKFFGIRVDEFGLGFPPRLIGKKIGETFYSFNLLPFGGFVKIYGEDSDEPGQAVQDKNRHFDFKPVWQRSIIILAGIVMNIVLGFLVLIAVFSIGSSPHLLVSDIAKDSPAFIAGVKTGDVIFEAKYNDKILVDPIKSSEFINWVKEAKDNEMLLKIKRGDKIIDVSLIGRVNPPAGQGSLGVGLAEIGAKGESFFKSIGLAFRTTGTILKLVALGFFNFITQIFTKPQMVESLTGPIGILTLAGQAGSLGIAYLLELMAMISLNLAVLNLIPFPALDGGRFLFLIIEKIKGTPIPRKAQAIANIVGFALLIVLMIIVSIQDVGRIIN